MNRPGPYAEDRLGASHNVDPDTSREAATLNYPRSGSQRARVLEALYVCGQRGATFQELQGLTGIESAAKRLTELKRDGWAKAKTVPGEFGGEVDARRATRSGASAIVYVATATAQLQLEAERAPRTTAGGGASSSSEDRADLDQGTPSARLVETPPASLEPISLFGDEPEQRPSTSPYQVEAA